MMFTSRTTSKSDPKPWVSPRGVRYAFGDLYFGGAELTYVPRPEFSATVNPILEAFRNNVANPHPDDYFDLSLVGITELWIQYLETGNQDVSHDMKHIAHALKVLTRFIGVTSVDGAA